jgi:hypothetical protein
MVIVLESVPSPPKPNGETLLGPPSSTISSSVEDGIPIIDCLFDAAPGITIVSGLCGLPKLETEDLLEAASSTAFGEETALSLSQFAGVEGREAFVGEGRTSARKSLLPCVREVWFCSGAKGGRGSGMREGAVSSARLVRRGVVTGVHCLRRCWLGS